jgi:hypothetical protein
MKNEAHLVGESLAEVSVGTRFCLVDTRCDGIFTIERGARE